MKPQRLPRNFPSPSSWNPLVYIFCVCLSPSNIYFGLKCSVCMWMLECVHIQLSLHLFVSYIHTLYLCGCIYVCIYIYIYIYMSIYRSQEAVHNAHICIGCFFFVRHYVLLGQWLHYACPSCRFVLLHLY